MLKMRNELLEFAERSHQYSNLEVLVDEFAQVIDAQGFGSFIMTGLPSTGNDVEPLVIANGWPVAWSDRYREQAYFADDPISKWSMTRTRPFQWRDAWRMHMQTERVKQINGEAKEHGMADGIAYPMRSIGGWQAVVSLASEYPLDIGPGGEALLHMASLYFHMRATEILSARSQVPLLSARQREILSWIAAGKSSWEISEILSIAQDTVSNHVKAIRERMNVNTAVQAVVLALKSGQIQP
ncbi:LuxR family transcriptional regulator [Mesorhizobium sp. 8]|uniref:LuxR family transcriptional regulator n=1 Tax=Mesorhizobium sp. 8 TaxID=2584466 RepID=UPI001121F528|nr:LuxR family transcriptional regulator [Mesorhizobium sp. 8]QDC00361.1 LuxR family transcriptional regulator [Mesorhizobium sp. 8]